MAKGKSKGTDFERTVCKNLSLWFTRDVSDAVFWRTSTSGARATQRSKKGKQTRSQYGDICATDPIGQPLIDLITFELKRGYASYSKNTLMDLIDSKPNHTNQLFAQWIKQATESSRQAKTPFWMMISRRDRQEAIVIIPKSLIDEVGENCIRQVTPRMEIYVSVSRQFLHLQCLRLDDFLRNVGPEDICALHHKYVNKNGKAK